MKKIYKTAFLSLALCSSLLGGEIRYGKGTFDMSMGVNKLFTMDMSLDIDVLTLSEHHANIDIKGLPFYYYYNVDIYTSDFVNKMTEWASYPVRMDIPFFGASIEDFVKEYTMIPVPADYKIRGFDMDIGFGYDVVKDPSNEENYIGVAVNTGVSMPAMKTENMVEDARLTYDLLKNTKTKIKTYKIGAAIHGNYEIAPKVSVYGFASYGHQTGTIENEYMLSDMDVDGTYTVVDFGIRYTPFSTKKDFGWISLSPKLYLTLGHTYKKWDVDDVRVNLFKFFSANMFGPFTTEFESQYTYIGVGYSFF